MIKHFRIILSGWNCATYVRACLDSLKKLDGNNWSAYVINDGSTDATSSILRKYNTEHYDINIYDCEENRFAAYRRWELMQENIGIWDDEDVVILVGLDDALFPDALRQIQDAYRPETMMSYGNWVDQRGKGIDQMIFQLDFDAITHIKRDYRSVAYRSTAPNTFKYKLFKKLRMEDFIQNGKWIDTCTETPAMFAFLEMCGKGRMSIIRKPIYLYNIGRKDGSILRWGRQHKQEVLKQILKLEKYNRYEFQSDRI